MSRRRAWVVVLLEVLVEMDMMAVAWRLDASCEPVSLSIAPVLL